MALPFTMDELQAAVADGQVTARRHPTAPYTIYNYSPEVQFTNRWNRVTLACRGLILDDDGNIVARPWEKFFNLGQVDLPIQFDTPVEVMDKADGSLGILFPMPRGEDGYQHYEVATRGSFESEQAKHATALWRRDYADYYEETLEALDEAYTFLFEIVYPANRIVLDYGGMDDLILLGAVQNENGYYCSPQYAKSVLEWFGPVVETYDYNTISDALTNMGRKNAEGYVIRSHNFMVKVKEPDYLELHKLVTNASPKTVWEQLRAGKSETQIISAFPDEFHDYIKSMIKPLKDAYEARVSEIYNNYSVASANVAKAKSNSVDMSISRRDYAHEFKKWKDARYFFLLLDNKSIRDVLWTELRPKEAPIAGDTVSP